MKELLKTALICRIELEMTLSQSGMPADLSEFFLTTAKEVGILPDDESKRKQWGHLKATNKRREATGTAWSESAIKAMFTRIVARDLFNSLTTEQAKQIGGAL